MDRPLTPGRGNVELKMEKEKVMDQDLVHKRLEGNVGNKIRNNNEYSLIHTWPFIVVVHGRQGDIGQLHPMK